MNDSVCPDCGGTTFYADHAAVVRCTYTVGSAEYGHYVSGTEEEVYDLDRDLDYLTCEGCGSEHEPEDLVSAEAYSEGI